MATSISINSHDGHPVAETSFVDRGLGEANEQAAPLDEVQPISCFAKTADGEVIGGAVGRRWGQCCELQQLWVASEHRRQGIGTQLLKAFEKHAQVRDCSVFYLETFSFQSPEFYEAQGYLVEYERRNFPHGIVKYHMIKHLA